MGGGKENGRVKEDRTRLEVVERRVVVDGLTDIMFDRYAGDNETKLEWWQKLYLDEDGETLVLPALNIVSFLSAHNTNSAPKRLLDKRKYKDVCNACLSFVAVGPQMIPFLRNGEPIRLGKIEKDRDPTSGVYMHRATARLDKGIPNPKERPTLALPWSLEFRLTILPTKEITEQQLRNLFENGGLTIGFGTFRGAFGKFRVVDWK